MRNRIKIGKGNTEVYKAEKKYRVIISSLVCHQQPNTNQHCYQGRLIGKTTTDLLHIHLLEVINKSTNLLVCLMFKTD